MVYYNFLFFLEFEIQQIVGERIYDIWSYSLILKRLKKNHDIEKAYVMIITVVVDSYIGNIISFYHIRDLASVFGIVTSLFL